jgi:hypothetical protein
MKYLFHTSKVSLTFCSILSHGADSFTFPLKEGLLHIFIAQGWVLTHRPWVQWQAHWSLDHCGWLLYIYLYMVYVMALSVAEIS